MNPVVHRILATSNRITPTLIRVGAGIAMFPHGAQKALGWYGGYGFSATVEAMGKNFGIPPAFAVLAIAAEFLGALGLITGFLTRVSAFGLAVTMAVAAMMGKHYEHGFFLNWFGNQKGEGLEYFLLILTLLAALLIDGGGRASVDGWLTRNQRESAD